MVASELTRTGKATVGIRNLMEGPRVPWKCKSGTGEVVFLLSERANAFTFWLESGFVKFLYIPLWDLSTAAVNAVVNKTKNCYLGRMQTGKFFASTLMISLLNQEFIFLGLRGRKRNAQPQDDNNTSRVLIVKAGMLCSYFAFFFPSWTGTYKNPVLELSKAKIACLWTIN